jgi:hypothetical protein
MFTFRVSADLAGAGDRFEAAYRQAVSEMKALLDAKAAQERETHGYQNRTGDLEASTYASDVVSTANGDAIEFGARMPYASYVAQRGLTRVEELAAEAEVELGYLFEGLGHVV